MLMYSKGSLSIAFVLSFYFEFASLFIEHCSSLVWFSLSMHGGWLVLALSYLSKLEPQRWASAELPTAFGADRVGCGANDSPGDGNVLGPHHPGRAHRREEQAVDRRRHVPPLQQGRCRLSSAM